MGKHQEQPQQEHAFAALVLEALQDQSEQLGHQWMEHAQLATARVSNLARDAKSTALSEDIHGAGRLIQALLAAAIYGAREQRSLTSIGMALGIEAYRRSMSVHLVLKELDLLSRVLLRGAEEVACKHAVRGTAQEGIAVGYRVTEVAAQFRLAVMTGYIEALSDELRERYRAIRHDLRNPLGTIKSAVAILTDETVPAELRESGRVHAMVARSTSLLDEMIDEVLGDTATRLHALEPLQDLPVELAREQLALSARKKRNEVARARERPDFEPDAF